MAEIIDLYSSPFDGQPACPYCGQNPTYVVSEVDGETTHQIACIPCQAQAERDYPHRHAEEDGSMAYAWVATFPYGALGPALDEWRRACHSVD